MAAASEIDRAATKKAGSGHLIGSDLKGSELLDTALICEFYIPTHRFSMEAHMLAVAEMQKASEAAVVSRVSLRDINRVIDEHMLSDAFVSLDNGRHALAGACSLIAFYFESARRLTSEERLFAIRTVQARLAKARTPLGGPVARGLDRASRVSDDRSYALYERCERTAGRPCRSARNRHITRRPWRDACHPRHPRSSL